MEPSKKVAFLLLTRNNFHKQDIFEKFFSDYPAYNLYIHSKEPLLGKFADKVIPNCIPTEWGKFSLVEATILLLKEAFKDPCNERFILLSESHFPLYDIETTCKKLLTEWNHMSVKPFITLKFTKSHQWFVFTRRNVEMLLNSWSDLRSCYLAENIDGAPDEVFFVWAAKKINIRVQDKANCFVEWTKHNPKDITEKGYNRRPYIFTSLKSSFLSSLRNRGYLFLRKVIPETIIE